MKRFAEREEMQIVGIYEDAGKSGKSIEGRPAFKKMLSDIENGLVNLTNDKILLGNSNDLVNKGRLTEMIAGLELIKYQPSTRKQSLFFWINTSKNSDAEVDYIIPHNGQILPIEIKAGVQGGMKSLYQFMNSKNIRKGVRSSLENFSHYTNGENEIDVIPLYALSNLFSQQ